MDFIGIDFETANEKRNSPCSIGIVVVKGGKVIEKIYHLIKPKEMRFTPINIGIHGIRPAMVKDELEFDKVWEKIKRYFDNTLVIAHNASFDISVLRNTLSTYNIEMPSFSYICTMKLSRNFYKNLDNARLNTVNKLLGYKFNHHDALADALACGNILINISKELNTTDINEISKLVGVTIGNVNNQGYKPSSSKGRIYKTSNKIFKNNAEDSYKINGSAFKDEVVVFTGKLSCMSRDEAIMMVRKASGIVGSSVTKKTTILVTNMKGLNLDLNEMSTKLRRATILNERGQNIKLINEDEFLQKIRLP
ncbi:MAG: exonuclease domain-containing protein [Clostridium sp.]|nr:exonuclease domain-containing protein [Clostridium sp.]